MKRARWIISKSHLLFVLSAIAFTTATQAQDLKPARTGTSLTRSFTFERPSLRRVDLQKAAYTEVALPGTLNLAGKEGAPALPVRFVKVLLPPGKTVSSVKVTGQFHKMDTGDFDLAARPVFPYQSPVPLCTDPPGSLVRDQTLYQSRELIPSEHYMDPRTGFCRGYAIFSVGLLPVKYAPARGELSYFSEMTLSLELSDGPMNPLLRPDQAKDAAWVRRLVCNPEAVSMYGRSPTVREEYPGGLCDPSESFDYVIITTTQNGLDAWPAGGALPYNWNSLMDKHEADDGLTCTLVTVEEICAEAAYWNHDPLFDDTPCRIREFCRDAYQDWGIEYILIGGDDEWIPAREMDSSVEHGVDADIYWNHLDGTFNDDGDAFWGEEYDTGFDLYADLFIGRVTADEPRDVSNWLTKSFFYADAEDEDYLDNAAFYAGDTGWDCEGDDAIDYSAIKGTDNWLGPDLSEDPPYPRWVGFQYGFETWNLENPGAHFDLTVKWTAEPPNPGGWMGGNLGLSAPGLRTAINHDACTLISGVAHANELMSLDVPTGDWESLYHNTRPFFLHDYGCHCGDMDAADDGILHSMLFHSDQSLAFACVYNTGYGWGNFYNTGSSSSLQQKSFWDYLFDVTNHSVSTANWQLGKAMASARATLAPAIDWGGSWRETMQCCLLFGDPAQRIKPPASPVLYISFPEGLPDEGFFPPGLSPAVLVEMGDGEETLVQGSEKICYRYDPGSPFIEASLTPLGQGLYEASLPATAPGDEPAFYFQAEGDGGSVVRAPSGAPGETYHFDVYLVEEIMHDSFESDLGWTVQNVALEAGAWERGIPIGGGDRGDPATDFDGSGHCCLTDNRDGNSDVDGGPTMLISPRLDLSTGVTQISYYRWHYCDDDNDLFIVQVSNDDGNSWTQVEATGHTEGWNFHSFQVADLIAPSSQMRVRFSAMDKPNDSITEAGLDAFQVRKVLYSPTLWSDDYTISAAEGAVLHLSLETDPAHAGRDYLVLGSFEGTFPGLPLPGGLVFPLNWDHLTEWIIARINTSACQNFYGLIDSSGKALATFDTSGPLDPKFAGRTISFAYLLGPDPIWDFVSNPIQVTIGP